MKKSATNHVIDLPLQRPLENKSREVLKQRERDRKLNKRKKREEKSRIYHIFNKNLIF